MIDMLGYCAPVGTLSLTLYALGLFIIGFVAGRVKRR